MNTEPLKPAGVRPLKRAEYDQLVELGAFEDEHVELLDGLLVVREPQAPYHAGTIDVVADLLRSVLGARARVRTPRATAPRAPVARRVTPRA